MVEDVFGIIGTTLAGTFHIEEVIAEGGFGVVYRAEHGAFRAPVALKCLKISGSVSRAKTDRLMESFREEAEILFHLSAHIPEVVRPLHADMMVLKDGTVVPYIAMEWVEGRPLDSIIIVREDEGLAPLTVGAVVKMLTPIAHALSKAHRFHVPGGAVVSVTHCDLKPENIVITDHGRPVRAKILDFGIARARDLFNQNVGKMTTSRVPRPFTPSYGAPEQWVPKRYGQTGPWTDVWGLALTMVECLTGKPPIDGDMHAMMGTALDPTRRPSPGADGVPISAAVEDVFQRGLAVDPRDRFQDIETFWSALEHAHGVASSFARARKRRARPTYDDDSLDSVRPPPPPAMQRSPRRPPRLTAAGPPLPTPSSAGRAAVRPNDGMEFRLEAEEPAIMRRATMQHGLPSLPQFPAAGLPSRQAFDPLAPESGREYSPVSEPEPSVQPAPANDDRAGTELDLGGLEDDVSEAFDRASSVAPGRGYADESVVPSAPNSGALRFRAALSRQGNAHEIDVAAVDDSVEYDANAPNAAFDAPLSAPLSGPVDAPYDDEPYSVRPSVAPTSAPVSGPREDEYGMPLPIQEDDMAPDAFELELQSMAPRLHAAGPSLAKRQQVAATARREPLPSDSAALAQRTLSTQLRIPALLLVAALVMTIIDLSIASSVGGTVSLGPIKLRWLAVALACGGIAVALNNFLKQSDQE